MPVRLHLRVVEILTVTLNPIEPERFESLYIAAFHNRLGYFSPPRASMLHVTLHGRVSQSFQSVYTGAGRNYCQFATAGCPNPYSYL